MKKEYLLEQFQKINVALSEKQVSAFMFFYERMIAVNQVMNLTGITEFEEVVTKHYIDSVCGMQPYMEKAHKVLDLGTGAGFPGIPLKIVYPEAEFVLLDSLKKRLNYLDEVIAELGWKQIRTLHGRAEDFGKAPTYREQFDLVVSRAVANLSSLSEYCLPFVKVGGCFISYKSGNIQDELKQSEKAIQLLGGKLEKTSVFCLPDTDISRSLVIIRKIKETPKRFPRKAGLPTREPLGV